MSKSKWFAYSSDHADSTLNLFCFPYAGGSASIFVQWKKYLSGNISVYPVLYPFREARRSERMPDTIQELAKNFVDDNIELLMSKEFAVFSHCAGSVIAYEAILYMNQQYGISPKFMIASGAEPPCYTLSSFAYLKSAQDDEFLQYLIDSRFVSADIVNNKGFLSYYIPIIREDFKALFNYSETKKEKLNCWIVSIVGDKDEVIDQSRLQDWSNYSKYKVMYKQYEGNHYYFTNQTALICSEIEKLNDGLEN